MKQIRGFASDNNSGFHPEILAALQLANSGHQVGYGGDTLTPIAKKIFESKFETDLDIYFVFNGTGSNVVALQSACKSFHSVICAETAHINVDECGAPEKFGGFKTITIATPDGKLTPALVAPHLHGFGFEHHSQPRAITITQTTELGTAYRCEEIKALADLAHQHNMILHVDGARISNAVAFLNCSLKTMLVDTGVDIISFGGTKNGMIFGEAVVFLNKTLSTDTKYYRKQSTQLFSKMRFIAAQFIAFFENDLWIKSALHANKMAQLLAKELSTIPEITITQKVESNGVFAIVPKEIIESLQKKFFFYIWDENINEVRWMTSFDTTQEDVMQFLQAIREDLSA